MSAKDKENSARALLRDALAEIDQYLSTERGRSRGAQTRHRWVLRRMLGHQAQYFSESGQDWFVDHILLKRRTGGVFVDVGGYDGVTGSNTLFFEMFRQWSGVLIEAVPNLVAHAKSLRRCTCIPAVLSGDGAPAAFMQIDRGLLQMSGRVDTYDSETLRRVRAHPGHKAKERTIDTQRLSDILVAEQITRVDYMSVDVEGAEYDILSTFPFGEIAVDVISVENNRGTSHLHDLLTPHGFRLVEFLGVDEMYCQSALLAPS